MTNNIDTALGMFKERVSSILEILKFEITDRFATNLNNSAKRCNQEILTEFETIICSVGVSWRLITRPPDFGTYIPVQNM